MKINMKMKMLSLAIVGLGGLALAGTSAAATTCPNGPDVAHGGAWTDVVNYQGSASINGSGGFDNTNCSMNSVINTAASTFASAAVHTDSPNNESRYRAQFSVDLDNLTNPQPSTGVTIFSARSSAAVSGIQLGIFGISGKWYLSYLVTDSNEQSGIYSNSVPLVAGVNRIEFDLQIGSTGSIALWVNNGTEASPTVAPHTINDASVVGVDDAYLGLAAPLPAFVAAYAGLSAQFDQFDSRRSTFIGTP